MTNRWRDALIGPGATVREALTQLGASCCRILLVVDESDRLLGTLSDGDIRRALLAGASLDTSIDKVMFRAPRTIPPGADESACVALMKRSDILQLPVVDVADRVVGLVLLEDLVTLPAASRPNWVVLMAGGKGERLRPLTDSTPKPMLPVGGRPLLETIIDEAVGNGLKHFYISVNYRADAIIDHFGDGSHLGAEIRYLREDKPLGTAGALGLITERPINPILVMNGDLLTKLNFALLLDHHAQQGSDVTICARTFDMRVPFGVLDLDGDRVRDIVEKPVQTYLVNAGIYVLGPQVLDLVPKDDLIDMPDLIKRVLDSGGSIGGFPIHEYWLDIGRADDFSRASSEFVAMFKPTKAEG